MMHAPLTVRKAGVHDLDAVYRLILSATERGKILKRSRREIEQAIHHFWVAEAQGTVVACCAMEVYNKKLAEIRSLAVDPAHQKRGIATRLIEHCIREAKQRKVYEVLVITDRENLFRRHGFSEQLHGQKALFLRP